MSKKQLTVYISIAVCAVVILCVLFAMNLPQSYDKTVVVDNAEEKNTLESTNPDVVSEVSLKRLPRDISANEAFGIWGWCGDKLVAQYINPYFKFGSDGKFTGLPAPEPDNEHYDFSKNALYMVNPSDENAEMLEKTGAYNRTWVYMSPDRNRLLLYEAYEAVGNGESQAETPRLIPGDGALSLEVHNGVKDRLKMYDVATGQLTAIDEWEPKYFASTGADGKMALQRDFGGAAWSADGKSVVYCNKTGADLYVFTVYNIQSMEKSVIIMEEKERRFDNVKVAAVSNDGRKLWFRGVKGAAKGFLEGYMDENTEAALYVADLENMGGTGAKKLIDNVYECRILSDGNTVVYFNYPNKSNFESQLYTYDISQNKNRLIDEHAVAQAFDISNDEKKLIYIAGDGAAYDVNMISLGADSDMTKLLLYKTGPNIYPAGAPLWNKDNSRIAVGLFTGEGRGGPAQVCILTLKKDK